jgi:hypothetical protein
MHPLPEDVSRRSTFDIVQSIRCEAKAGLSGFSPNDEIITGSTIGLGFTFDMTEVNNASSGGLDFLRPGNPRVSLELDASATKRRNNRREFKVLENLKELYAADCSTATASANRLYPIAGAVGVDEVVRTYIRLRQLTDLKEKGVNLFSDSLHFTTTLNAGATPTLTLAAVAGSFRLTSASVALSAQRTDIHNVDVVLAYDTKKTAEKTAEKTAGANEGAGRKKVASANKQLAYYPPPRPQGSGQRSKVQNQEKEGSAAGTTDGGSGSGLDVEDCERWRLLEKDVLRDARTIEALVRRCLDARNRVLMEMDRLRDLREDETSAAKRLGERLLEIMRLP